MNSVPRDACEIFGGKRRGGKYGSVLHEEDIPDLMNSHRNKPTKSAKNKKITEEDAAALMKRFREEKDGDKGTQHLPSVKS